MASLASRDSVSSLIDATGARVSFDEHRGEMLADQVKGTLGHVGVSVDDSFQRQVSLTVEGIDLP